jgi:hypothetical protein
MPLMRLFCLWSDRDFSGIQMAARWRNTTHRIKSHTCSMESKINYNFDLYFWFVILFLTHAIVIAIVYTRLFRDTIGRFLRTTPMGQWLFRDTNVCFFFTHDSDGPVMRLWSVCDCSGIQMSAFFYARPRWASDATVKRMWLFRDTNVCFFFTHDSDGPVMGMWSVCDCSGIQMSAFYARFRWASDVYVYVMRLWLFRDTNVCFLRTIPMGQWWASDCSGIQMSAFYTRLRWASDVYVYVMRLWLFRDTNVCFLHTTQMGQWCVCVCVCEALVIVPGYKCLLFTHDSDVSVKR